MEPADVGTLIARCVQGDDAARAEFFAAYDDVVRRSVSRKLRDVSSGPEFATDVDDICHDVYVRIFRNNCEALARIREPRSISAWLMTISQNHVYSYLRKRRVISSARETAAKEIPASYAESPEAGLIERESVSILRRNLEKLEAKDRLILQLYYLDDLTYAEIAETLSLNINTVASRLMRAKAKLRERLTKDTL